MCILPISGSMEYLALHLTVSFLKHAHPKCHRDFPTQHLMVTCPNHPLHQNIKIASN